MDFTKVKENLEKRGYKVSCFATGKEACEYLNGELDGVSIGMGGSMTLKEIGLYEALKTHNEVYWHQVPEGDLSVDELREKAATADVYFSSANGLAETGEIINIDGRGNRIASTMYGHKKVYFVIGSNKIAEDYDAAYHRARNIAGPRNAQRFQTKTPCVAKGDRCYDCKSPERICRGLFVLWQMPMGGDYEIILIDEELGY